MYGGGSMYGRPAGSSMYGSSYGGGCDSSYGSQYGAGAMTPYASRYGGGMGGENGDGHGDGRNESNGCPWYVLFFSLFLSAAAVCKEAVGFLYGNMSAVHFL